MRWVGRAVAVLLGLCMVVAVLLRVFFGGGRHLDDRSTDPELPASALELVAALDYPPGNIAVSPDGRVFLTLHPDGDPPLKVAELIDGRPVPYPDAAFQSPRDDAPYFQTVLSMRLDQRGRLWVLDYGNYARGQPQIFAFDILSGEVVHYHPFSSDVAGLFSMLNDFQVSPDGRTIYIAEASPILHTPAVIVYDTVRRTSRRLLERHRSVMPMDYILRAGGRDMIFFGLVTMRVGVDSIALDPSGTYLYSGPVNGDRMYRIATRDLRDPSLAPEALAERVEDFAPKPLSDGLSMDRRGTIYVTDPEHSAVLALGQDRALRTLVKDPRLRWPDGLSFGPDGWLYVTCSALQHVLFKTAAHVRAHAPYHVYRFQPGAEGMPGH